VTHEPEVAAYADRVIQMRDGRKVSDAPAKVSGYVRSVVETSA
jgi:ABC-type lipoprotein export system ATPase subunit